MSLDILREFISEVDRPPSPSKDWVFARRASSELDDAVQNLEHLAQTRYDLEPVIEDLISAIHRVQETIDRFEVKDDRFK